jgi:hypothetical protein
VRMVDQKRTPGLRGPWAAADHVCGDGRLRHSEPQFQELTVNPRRTPQGIRGRHRAKSGRVPREGRSADPAYGGSSTSNRGGTRADARR